MRFSHILLAISVAAALALIAINTVAQHGLPTAQGPAAFSH